MATTRRASAEWNGNLLEGNGTVTLESSGIGSYPVSWPARSAEPNGVTSPEELIAAAHSTCFSMALSHGLAQAGTPPTQLRTSAEVDFQPGTGITAIRLTVSRIAVMPVPGWKSTSAEVRSCVGGVPAWASPCESAIEKHVEWAAAMSSSGLVTPFGSAERAGHETG